MNIFEQLEQKTEPSTKKEFQIKIKVGMNKRLEDSAVAVSDDLNLEDFEESRPNKSEQFTPLLIIKDKSKVSHLNREDILERLKLISKVKQQLVSQAPTPAEAIKASEDFNEFNESILEKPKESESDEEEESTDEKSESESDDEEESMDKKSESDEDEEMDQESRTKKRTTRKIRIREPVDLDIPEEDKIQSTKDYMQVKIGKTILRNRLPPSEKIIMPVSPFYMNNRKQFIQKLSTIFASEIDKLARNKREGAEEISCEDTRKEDGDISLLTHQEVVRDYLNLYTPYHGLLLYHGLGSGKTCSSIAIAEGMKTDKRIVLMTPASLKMNFFSELKKCGDHIYRKNQFWEFIPTDGQPPLVSTLSQSLGLPPEFIREKGGAWLTDISKKNNFGSLSTSDQKSLDEQINMMIRAKYLDINYNGLNERKMRELADLNPEGTRNPFDHSVVIIDEAHNLVSRISNKIGQSDSIAGRLYDWLLSAIDIRVVLLTGTPIINYPHEVGILFNILRGNIKTWEFQLKQKTTEKFNRDSILREFISNGFNTYDYVEYSGDKLTVTRNPFGFVNTFSDKGKRGGQQISKESTESNESKKSLNHTKRIYPKKSESRKTKRSRKEEPDEKQETHEKQESDKTKTFLSGQEESELNKEATRIQYDVHDKMKGGSKIVGGGPFEDYEGVILDNTGNLTDDAFQRRIISILSKKATVGKPTIINHKCLPDNSKQFSEMFIQANGDVVHIDAFKRRILGLTSYFRSAQEQLLPRFVKAENGATFHKIVVDMSPHQFAVYNKIRNEEREKEKKQRKKSRRRQEGAVEEVSSSYRIFSRAACNFTFPNDIIRPMPPKIAANMEGFDDFMDDMVAERMFNAVTSKMIKERDDYFGDEDEGADIDAELDEETAAGIRAVISKVKAIKKKERVDNPQKATISDREIINYQQQIDAALKKLEYNEREPTETNYLLPEGLEQYSPKLLRVLENIRDPENEGLHLLYSQFRTIEGIGIMKLILEANGFEQFRISRVGDTEWSVDESTLESDKPKFILYTGTETAEEKEILRNIYNSAWEYVPASIVASLKTMLTRDRKSIEKKNFMGDVIKVMMITSSGAEGINLRNTRFVHIVEPYWNKARLDQVIGRARRICSHQDLPEELRTVKVFIYISTLSKAQREDKNNRELMLHDLSKVDGKTAFTTDESLYEISEIKDRINTQILRAIKETAIDCTLYNKESNPDDPLVCYGFGKVSSNQFGSHPTLEEDIQQPVAEQAMKEVKWTAKRIKDKVSEIEYAMNPRTNEVYDLESYERYIDTGSELQLIGNIRTRMVNGKKVGTLEKL